MKVKPMIFNTEMVKALMSGKKTVTRRPLNVQPNCDDHRVLYIVDSTDKKEAGKLKWFDGDSTYGKPITKPCNVGDLIYVRETFAALGHNDYQQVSPRNITDIHEYRYKASERESIANCKDHEVLGYKWVPSIHMPRYASRLTLKVTDVRIERVQNITPKQALSEGINHHSMNCPVAEFGQLWDSIYQDWDKNPHVWVIEFEVINMNVDKCLGSL